jgi:protein-L-isoaspartate(D-aspartate) O-methyltransferase
MSADDDRAAVLRAEMVARLAERGWLSEPRVAAALGQVPRHVFVPGVELPEAYANRAVVTRHRGGSRPVQLLTRPLRP